MKQSCYAIPCLSILLALLTFGCGNSPSDQPAKPVPASVEKMELKYATGFEVAYYDGYKIVRVTKPYMGATEHFEYMVMQDGSSPTSTSTPKTVIKAPVKRLACTSTTHIPMLDYLKASEALVGFPTTDYISSEKTRKLVDQGHVAELGVDKELNLEKLVEIDPQMVMAYTVGGDYGQFKKIEQLGIPVVLNAEYLEEHPLGRAEWIKFMAAFLNKEAMADSIFNVIEHNYQQYQQQAATVSNEPTVLSGVVYGDTWYMPGGKNYAARLIDDAGGQYLWSQDSTRGFLELSFEAVYEKAHQADYWIGVASFESLAQLTEADNRYGDFKAHQQQQVYTNNWRKGAKGGSEFLELGYLRPDIILADLIHILHPGLLPDHHLYFHQPLP